MNEKSRFVIFDVDNHELIGIVEVDKTDDEELTYFCAEEIALNFVDAAPGDFQNHYSLFCLDDLAVIKDE